MKICNLASGSKGNCTYIESNGNKILIDLGKNKKYIVDKLESIGVNYKDIDIVLLTHTHDDHTAALKTFFKNHKAKLYITKPMQEELGTLDDINVVIYENNNDLSNINIESYKMSHDVKDCRSFIINENDKSIVYITDTGYINSRYFKYYKNKDIYFIESNHDIEMLTHGPYPEWLQKRILSDEGHLSNNFCGIYLSKIIGDKTKYITLLHLSEHNNSEVAALDEVLKYIDTSNIKLTCAYPNQTGEVIEI